MNKHIENYQNRIFQLEEENQELSEKTFALGQQMF